jgi:hypothetical protein
MSILTYDVQKTIKEVSLNNIKKYNQILKETEDLEMYNLLGQSFYQEILDNYTPTTTATTTPDKWQILVEGGTFTNSCGDAARQRGLQYVLAYLVYAQYIVESYVNDTFTGMVQKVRPDSETVSQGTMKNLRQHNREIAFNYYESIKEYLCLNTDLYPNFSSYKTERKNVQFKIFSARKTIL